ncbi:Phosphotransferase enzyme family protein [Streptomyces sp. DvalAA-14]|uniref:phosphotransferase family protein n=1 Tax=unclassified Streptomyces TaxID=2593676 RepID=UPI00081B324A|nr:phosphotransferase [Streptomyces sp. DvalAA-14]MYS23823.1 phosphotransferase [Streptomyces sp. SID4948]SCE39023.1 Phosphotransferase enzyme family protein [Streptomyces sp. DvalAA-14]
MTRDQLAGAAQAALGGGRRLDAVERVAGGTTKGVYRLTMDDGMTAIAYLWGDSENYWPATEYDGDLADPFSPGVGLELFEAAHARLKSLGVRVLEVHLVDRDRTFYPADLAIVEDVPGGDLMDLSTRDPRAAEPAMARLAESLAVMRRHRGPSFGKVALIDAGGTSRPASCEQAALAFALRCLAEATARDHRIADASEEVEERLRQLTAAVRPRAEYSVVHGELGLDHVMVDRDGHPVVIDIENLLYFDVEWEHVFLRLRHTDSQYRQLAVDGLDEDRLALYKLTQHLSLTAGPLRLLDGDFPDREFMQGIAEHHLNEALVMVRWS